MTFLKNKPKKPLTHFLDLFSQLEIVNTPGTQIMVTRHHFSPKEPNFKGKDTLNLGQKYSSLIGMLCYNRWQGSYPRLLSKDLGNKWKRFTDERWDNLKINKANNFSVLKHMK